jgi:hypothetical protein
LFGLFACALCENELHPICGSRVQQDPKYHSICSTCRISVAAQNEVLQEQGATEVSVLSLIKLQNARRMEDKHDPNHDEINHLATKEACAPSSSFRKHRGTSSTRKRERNIEAMTNTTTTLSWLQKHEEIQHQHQAKEDASTINPQTTAETTPPMSSRPLNNSTIMRRLLPTNYSRVTEAESKRNSLLLYFFFLVNTILIIVQVVFVERLMENDVNILNGASHNNQHYSIHQLFLRGRQISLSNTTGIYGGQTKISEKLELSKDDLTILQSSQLLPPISLLQEVIGGASMNISIQKSLPSLQDIDQLYGSETRIYGLKNACPIFRANVQAEERIVAPAGMFNTVCVSYVVLISPRFYFLIRFCVLIILMLAGSHFFRLPSL